MPGNESMNGRYYRTCSDDITSSPGWFKNILLLGLLNFVPVFGQMSVSGYAYEWAHKAAWRVNSPMPYKVYGRKNSKMLRWGWFAIVVAVVFAIIPCLVYALGSGISDSFEASADFGQFAHRGYSLGAGSAAGLALGGAIQFIGLLGVIFAGILSWAGTIRMTIYDRLGAGLQFKQVWKMATRDFGGLMRIFGMQLIVGLVICLLGWLVFGISAFIGGAGFLASAFGMYATGGGAMSLPAGAFMMFLAILPLLLIDAYIVSCMCVYAEILVARAVGHWCAQFDVGQWGTKDDPLPFEREETHESERPERPEGTEPGPVDDEDAPTAEASAADAGASPDDETASEEGQTAAAEADSDADSEPDPAEEEPSRDEAKGPVGWRAAGTSAADRPGDGPQANS